MEWLVFMSCLVVALLGQTQAASLTGTEKRIRRSIWNDPNHPFPDSSWSDWTPCTAECEQGYQGRHTCGADFQMPDISDPFSVVVPNIPGCNIATAGCNLQPCRDKFDWQEFSDCSADCDGGERVRLTGPGCYQGDPPGCPTETTKYQQAIKCHAQSCTKVDSCGKADIMYVLDSSGSVGEYNWFKEKQFAIDVARALDIGSDETRVGVVSYSNEVSLDFSFSKYSNIEDVASAIWGIPWMAGSTNTADAIRKARMVLGDEGRADVKKTMVVITDGNSNILNETTIPQADLARQEGIVVYVVGIGSAVNDKELLGIGNAPSETYVHHVEDFESLADITQTIVEAACVSCDDWKAASRCCNNIQKYTRECTEKSGSTVKRTWTESENRACSTNDCEPECGAWGNVGECSVTCGGGNQKQTRVCKVYVNGNPESKTEEKSVVCNTEICPRKICGSFEPSSECSVTCGNGTLTICRTCRWQYGDGAVGDPFQEEENDECEMDPCIVIDYGTWSSWSECPVTCGGGKQSRTRQCTKTVGGVFDSTWTEPDTERDCSTNPCPVTQCEEWQPDGPCSKSCGGGTQKFKRVCKTHEGSTLTDTKNEENSEPCNSQDCPERECDDWAPSSECSVTCGPGTQTWCRTCEWRVGDTVVGDPEAEEENRNCELTPCVETNCDEWSEWCECSVSCGGGVQSRTRQCTKTINGVFDSTWEDPEEQACSTDACIVTECGDWQPDGICSQTCGGGYQNLTRLCTTWADSTIIEQETQVDHEICNDIICPTRVCGDWGESSKCSVTCGQGTQTWCRTCHWRYGDGAVGNPEQEEDVRPCKMADCIDCKTCEYSKWNTAYMADPTTPCKYYMCVRYGRAASYTYVKHHMTCGPGTAWDQSILTCNTDRDGDCPSTVDDDEDCEAEPGACTWESVSGDNTKFRDIISGTVQSCAPGTVFDQDLCGCNHGDNSAEVCDGPLLYFKFDDNFKSSGCEEVEAYQEGASFVTFAWDCKAGKSASFNGAAVLAVPFLNNYFADRNIQAFTVALWFKWTGDSSKLGGLVNNGDCETVHSFSVHVGDVGQVVSGDLRTDGLGTTSTDSSAVGRWDWVHVAETYDGQSLKLYVNGVEKSSTSLQGPIANTQCSMIIGQLGQDEQSGLFKGFIDELRVYTRCLDAGEIRGVMDLTFI